MEEVIWTEKYRPKKLDDVVGQKNIITALKQFIEKKSLPHCLFAGKQGIGKTTTALCIAHELYGNQWKNNFLELNASDERGIDTIRTKVKDFARTLSFDKNTFKIIYLDEADALTRDAQQALRRMMEKYVNTCRFILSVNYSSRIIPPIQSRCAVFRFLPIKKEKIKKYLNSIIEKESVKIDDKAVDLIIDYTEGDLRQSINLIQIASIYNKQITENDIVSIIKKTLAKDAKELMNFIIKKDFSGARKKLLDLFYESGLDGSDIIKAVHKEIFNLEIPDKTKMVYMKKLGEYEYRLIEGSDPLIQLEAMISDMMLIN